jgi:hypothetical protein
LENAGIKNFLVKAVYKTGEDCSSQTGMERGLKSTETLIEIKPYLLHLQERQNELRFSMDERNMPF